MSLTRALAVHLRVFAIHGTTLRVVTLRPQTPVRFSTNYFHGTWHILAGRDGAVVLGRLLWGLAFQRQPGTLVLIDRAHLVPTPFEADPPDPVLLVPDGLTRVDVDLLRALARRLRRAPGPPTTIRWHTFGMPAALAAPPRASVPWRDAETAALRSRERMSRRAGFICYTAPPPILRAHALAIYRAHAGGATYHPLAEHDHRRGWGYDGELQLIPSFAADVSTAIVARRELLGKRRTLASEDERRAVWARAAEVRRRRRRARSRADGDDDAP